MTASKNPARYSPEWYAKHDAADATQAAGAVASITRNAERDCRVGRGLDLTIEELDALNRAEAILRRYAQSRTTFATTGTSSRNDLPI